MVPKVSVITRTTGARPRLLRRAIESVLGQTLRDWQHVVVNDGGDPAALKAIFSNYRKDYAGRLLLIHQENRGMQAAANRALQESESTYVCLHDDDDSWEPEFLEATVGFLEEAGEASTFQGVITKTTRILEEENADGSFREVSRVPYIPLENVDLFRIGYENPFSPIAFLYRRKAHAVIGDFDPRWDMAADLDFNFRFLQHFNIGIVPRPLANYHWRTEETAGPAANTVTAKRRRHGQLLAELKNHYLRSVSDEQSAVFALAFLISHYAVENQWMTADARERGHEAVGHLLDLKTLIGDLQRLQQESVLPKLIGQVIPALGRIEQAVSNPAIADAVAKAAVGLATVHAAVEDLCKATRHHDEQLRGVLDHQAALRERIDGLIDEVLYPKLNALIEAQAAAQSAAAEQVSAFAQQQLALSEQAKALASQAGAEAALRERIDKLIDEVIFPKLSGLEMAAQQADKALRQQAASLQAQREDQAQVASRLEHLADAILARQAEAEVAQRGAIESMSASLSAQLAVVTDQLATLQQQLDEVRASEKRSLKLGPLWIRWGGR